MKALRVWGGGVAAFVACFLALMVVYSVVIAVIKASSGVGNALPSPPIIVGCAAFLFTFFPLVGGALGMLCAFFWHPIATPMQGSKWGYGVLGALSVQALIYGLIPAIVVGGALIGEGGQGAGILFVVCGCSLFVICFRRALNFGLPWWEGRGWRRLFGSQWRGDEKLP